MLHYFLDIFAQRFRYSLGSLRFYNLYRMFFVMMLQRMWMTCRFVWTDRPLAPFVQHKWKCWYPLLSVW